MTDNNSQKSNSEPETNISDFYLLGETIGEGTFGKVKKALHILTQEKIAVKILQKTRIRDQSDIDRIARELNILQRLKHPNVILLYDIIETRHDLYIIMEYASEGELFNYILKKKHLTELEACKFFQQIIDGVEYIHKNFIVHRDLKPENLLIDSNGNIKMIDFGLGNEYSKGVGALLKTACGSPCYAAPEMLQGRKYQGLLTDIWSSGVILFAMLCGYLPFEDPNTDELFKKIIDGKFDMPENLSEDAKDLLRNILKTDPRKRFNLLKIKNHKWFNLCKYEEKPNYIKKIDDDIIKKVAHMGLDEKACKKFLIQNEHNYLTASYYLLLQKKYRQQEHMQNFMESLKHPHKPKRSLSCQTKLMFEPSIFDIYFYHTLNEKIFISTKAYTDDEEKDKEETIVNLSGLLNEPIFESNFENIIDSDQNSKNYENNTDKIPSKMSIPSKKPMKTINLYDKYRDKYVNKAKKTEKFTFPSPERNPQVENKEMKIDSNKKPFKKKNLFLPQSTRNQPGNEDLSKMYKIFMDNSILLKKMSQRIKKPLSTKMKEGHLSKNNHFNTFCTEISSLSYATSPQNVQNTIENQQILAETLPSNEIIKSNSNKYDGDFNESNKKCRKSNEKRDVSENKKGKTNNQKQFSYTERKKNNTFHIDENLEKKYYSSKKENNIDTTTTERKKINVKMNQNNSKSEKTSKNSDFFSVTSKDPAFLMKKIEKALRASNFLVKNINDFQIEFEKLKYFKGECSINSLGQEYEGLYIFKFVQKDQQNFGKYKSFDFKNGSLPQNTFISECAKIFKALEL